MDDTGKGLPAPIKCTVISCPNFCNSGGKVNSQLKFFDFPPDRGHSKIWKEKCGVAAHFDSRQAKVCSEHFRPTDYEADTKLKPEAVPRENLEWMFGAPEFTVAQTFKLEVSEVKQVVDENEYLKQYLGKLQDEITPLKEKMESYDRRIRNLENEIYKTQELIFKMPVKKKKFKTDTNLICKVFSQAQINMLMGKKKVIWSYDDMAMAFTLRHTGNKECYLYLKDMLNMPLPSLSSVQKWVASNK